MLIKETVLMGGLSQKHKTAVLDTKALSYDEPTHINSAFAPQLKWNGTDLLKNGDVLRYSYNKAHRLYYTTTRDSSRVSSLQIIKVRTCVIRVMICRHLFLSHLNYISRIAVCHFRNTHFQ